MLLGFESHRDFRFQVEWRFFFQFDSRIYSKWKISSKLYIVLRVGFLHSYGLWNRFTKLKVAWKLALQLANAICHCLRSHLTPHLRDVRRKSEIPAYAGMQLKMRHIKSDPSSDSSMRASKWSPVRQAIPDKKDFWGRMRMRRSRFLNKSAECEYSRGAW